MVKALIGIVLVIIGLMLAGSQVVGYVLAENQYTVEIYNYWSLADKASTIEAKSMYMDKFVGALDNAGLQGSYNAIWLQNPDNSFDKNFEMLQTLQIRLHEIKNMNVSSFEYQQAMAQITAQEQGEAQEMLSVFEGVWYLNNHMRLWNWIWVISVLFGCALIIIGILLLDDDWLQ